MRSPATSTLLIVVALSMGCGGGAPSGAAAPTDRPAAPVAASGAESNANAAEPSTEAATKSALSPKDAARARRESCQEAAQAIQQAQESDVLLNIHNSRTVLELAEVLEEAADSIEQIEPDAALGPLKELLSNYSGTSRSMAQALAATADANSVEARKTPLGEFRDLEPKLRVVINDIGAYCNAG